jgi:hypothetical protein
MVYAHGVLHEDVAVMGIYICDYCRLDYNDIEYDQAERLEKYDLVCDSCNVNRFNINRIEECFDSFVVSEVEKEIQYHKGKIKYSAERLEELEQRLKNNKEEEEDG